MKRLIIIFLCFNFLTGYAQKTISRRSKAMKFNMEEKYERGLPPNLWCDLNYEDANGNGILEVEENSNLYLKITNKGKGLAQDLLITIKDNHNDPEFYIEDKIHIPYIYPGKSFDIVIPIKAGFNLQTTEHKLEINVTEHFGYDMDKAYLILNCLGYQKPKLVFSGLEVIDYGEGTMARQQDNLLQAGEQVKIKIIIQNTGQNIATNTKYKITTNDENIYLVKNIEGYLGDIAIGEVKDFWITISPNRRVTTKEKLPVFLTLEEDIGRGNLIDFRIPLYLNQKVRETAIVQVEPDIEMLRKQKYHFETTSHKFTVNVGNLINIKEVISSNTKRNNSVAVIFGVENYTDLPPAPYAKNDAEIIEEYFKKRLGVEQVRTYKNEDVSGYIFDNVFDPDYGELQKAVLKGQTDLFVFYSGHGVPSKDGENIYLFPADGKVARLETQGYNLNKLYENLEKLEARSTTVFIDACFSGASKASEKIKSENLISMKGVKIVPKTRQPWLTNPNFNVFTSSGAEETSLGFDLSQTGLFTYYLCAGMQGEADEDKDGKITAGELKNYVTENVKNMSKKIMGLQTPKFHGNENMVLIEYKEEE
jgi:hypothetical protein